MTDVTGLALSVLGLGGLFSTCVQALELAQIVNNREKDLALLHAKLENQKIRFVTWGKSVEERWTFEGFKEVSGEDGGGAIGRTLLEIAKLVLHSHTLETKYGLVLLSQSHTTKVHKPPVSMPREELARRITNLFPWWDQTRKATLWTVLDRQRFQALIQDLKELIDDLEMLTSCCIAKPMGKPSLLNEPLTSKRPGQAANATLTFMSHTPLGAGYGNDAVDPVGGPILYDERPIERSLQD